MNKTLCAPSKTATAAGGVTGLVFWALMSFVPAFHNGVPEPVVDIIPVLTTVAGHFLGAWLTPHEAAPAPAGPAAPVKPAA